MDQSEVQVGSMRGIHTGDWCKPQSRFMDFPFPEVDSWLPITRCGNRLSTSVYRKPTHTDRYLPSHSHHHSRMLTGVMQCMHYRAHQILLFHVTIPHLFKACFSLYSSVIQLTKAYAAETSCVIESMLCPVLKVRSSYSCM